MQTQQNEKKFKVQMKFCQQFRHDEKKRKIIETLSKKRASDKM